MPRPMPGTRVIKINCGIVVVTLKRMRMPRPSVDTIQPSQIVQRYAPVKVMRNPVAMANGATVKVLGNNATPDMMGL